MDEIAHKTNLEGTLPTSSTIPGPFWSPNAPERELGDSVIQDFLPGGQKSFMQSVLFRFTNLYIHPKLESPTHRVIPFRNTYA